MTQDKVTKDDSSWRDHLVDHGEGITRILDDMGRIAVLGVKPEDAGGPAYHIARSLVDGGYDVVPVPVYFPGLTEMFGKPVHRSLATVDPPADMVLLFRRSTDIPGHMDDIIAARPKVVWMQKGIRNDEIAEQLAREGIDVVQDRCIRTELDLRRSKSRS